MQLHVSTGNSKLGAIPSISLPPIKTCGNVLCTDSCYALNITRRFEHVKLQWESNLEYYLNSTYYPFPGSYFGDLLTWIEKHKPSHFRFHIGGDCPDKNYLKGVYTIVTMIPNTNFMLFTKRYSWVKPSEIPNNLNILLSMWPYMEEPDSEQTKVWIRGDLRRPEDSFICKGCCTDCLQCWNKKVKHILLKGP
jgi:hypothetical protein